MKRIPKNLRTAIIGRMKADPRPMKSGAVAEAVNPIVPKGSKRTAKQMAFVLKRMVKDGDLVVATETKNGITAHGNERSRKEYSLNHEVHDPDVVTEEVNE